MGAFKEAHGGVLKELYLGKQYGELMFWRAETAHYQDWVPRRVGSLYGKPPPDEPDKQPGDDDLERAVRTWVHMGAPKYPTHLRIGADSLSGRRVLDVGCGPIPHLLAFRDCQRYGLDQLVEEYAAIGYPTDRLGNEITYISSGAESIPVEDGFFDAVLSDNALDHVDDFAAASREICRILKPGGLLLYGSKHITIDPRIWSRGPWMTR